MDELSEKKKRQIETDYVKSTYELIADDFSKTRYKKWPKVDEFLHTLSKDALLLDVGCGNGKYLDNLGTFNIGCDISSSLLKICKERRFEVLNCDMRRIPFREGRFDALICIAALHHIVSHEARAECVKSMLDLLVNNGLLYLQVWAFEQQLDDTKYLSKAKMNQSIESSDTIEGRELYIDDCLTIPIHINRTPFRQQEMLVPFSYKDSATSKVNQSLRYYHLFKEGELENLLSPIDEAELVESFYDNGNWCVCIKKRLNSIE